MASEASSADRAQRARELHAAIKGLKPAYKPADPKFALTSLMTAITTAETALTTVDTVKVPFDDATGERTALLKSLGPLVTQALAFVKSNTAWTKKYDAVKTAADKVRGVRPPKPKKKVVPPGGPTPEQKKARQQGERSYAEIAGFFRKFVDRVTALPGYTPPDAKIGAAALATTRDTLETLNRDLPTLESAYDDAVDERTAAYTGAEGLKFVWDGSKTTVKGQYGQSSEQFVSIKGIKW